MEGKGGGLGTASDGLGLVGGPELGDVGGEGIFGVGSGEEGLDGEQHRPDLQRRRPLVCKAGTTLSLPPPSCNTKEPTFEDVQAYPPQLVDVGVVDFGHESDFGCGHGVLFGQEELQLKHSALEGTLQHTSLLSSGSRGPGSGKGKRTPSGPATMTWK